MMILADAVTFLGILSLAIPLWYLPARRLAERFGWPRHRSGRIHRANLIDWLNATGCGVFLAAILLPLGQFLRRTVL